MESSPFALILASLINDAKRSNVATDVKERIHSIEQCIMIAQDEDLPVISAELFPKQKDDDAQKGILDVLSYSMKNHKQGEAKELRCETLRFLELYIEQLTLERYRPELIAQHAVDIITTCCTVLRRDDSNMVRELAFHPLTLCVELSDLVPDYRQLTALLFEGRLSILNAVWSLHSAPLPE